MRFTPRRILQTFLTGLFAALPLVATVLVFTWMVRLLYGWIGPNSLIGSVLVSIGIVAPGGRLVGYLLGVAIVLVLIFLLGLLVKTRVRDVLAQYFQAVLQRIPLVRNVYDVIKKVVDLLAQREQVGMRSMSAVWLHFGGPGGVAVLALLSMPEPVMLNGKPYLAVLVPTAPVPVGGGLLYVPAEWVMPADVGVEALTSIYVSMGLTSHQHLGPKTLPTAVTPSSRVV